MSIDKIAFQSLEQSQQLPPAKKEEVKNVPDNELSAEDKEKANASKYMIGAAALAGVIALGIIGHKNNWWRRAQDIGEDIAKKGSDAVQGGERKAAQTAEDAASAGSKADDIQTPNPNESSTPKAKSQPEEKADSVPGAGSEANVEFPDFSKLEGERSVRDGMHVISQKGENGKLLREYISKDNKTISSVTDYDPATGKRIKETDYAEDGKTIWRVVDYDPATGDVIKLTGYYDDGKTIKKVKEMDTLTHNVKITNYDRNGNVIDVEK